jgi:protein phosphatase
VSLSWRYAARSDVGLLREGNEDSMYAGPHLLAVADGMGGHAAGEVASRVVIETVAGLDSRPPGDDDLTSAMRQSVETANNYLRDMVAADSALEGMGTTLTALLWVGRQLGLVHIGDSRAYLLRDGAIEQVTHDHTLVQNLIDEGRISVAEASTHPQRSWITNALDGRDGVEPDLSIREARPGDRYLVCSDGLSSYVSEETIAEALRLPDPHEACDRLIELALRAGGPDNVTCIVADVVDTEGGGDSPIVGGAAAEDGASTSRAADSPAARAAAITPRETAPLGNPTQPPPREPASEADRADADTDTDTDEHTSASGSRRIVAVLVGVVVLVALAGLATFLYIRTQFYVGVADGPPASVGVYRGVSGSVLGVQLSRLADRTNLPVTALPDFERSKVVSGIQASSQTDAQRIVTALRQEACARSTPSPQPSASARARTRRPAPTPTPSPTPAYCAAAP